MRIIITILILVNIQSYSQSIMDDIVFSPVDSGNIEVSTYARGYYGSSLFTNEFIDKFRHGGYISSDLKDETLNRSQNFNFFGGEGIYGIKFSNTKNKLFNDWGYYGDISSYSSGSVQFSKDLFELAFYGNQNLIGDTIQLNQTAFHTRNYLKLAFGITNEQLSIGVGIQNISSYIFGAINNGFVYTDQNIDEIKMEVFLNLEKTETIF